MSRYHVLLELEADDAILAGLAVRQTLSDNGVCECEVVSVGLTEADAGRRLVSSLYEDAEEGQFHSWDSTEEEEWEQLSEEEKERTAQWNNELDHPEPEQLRYIVVVMDGKEVQYGDAHIFTDREEADEWAESLQDDGLNVRVTCGELHE